jgi:biopolymer transport protein ExbD
MKDMKAWLDAEPGKRDEFHIGIPYDSLDNQLAMWIRMSRTIDREAEVAIRGDANASYTVVKKVMDMMQENNVNKFNLTTNLVKEEVKPEEVK